MPPWRPGLSRRCRHCRFTRQFGQNGCRRIEGCRRTALVHEAVDDGITLLKNSDDRALRVDPQRFGETRTGDVERRRAETPPATLSVSAHRRPASRRRGPCPRSKRRWRRCRRRPWWPSPSGRNVASRRRWSTSGRRTAPASVSGTVGVVGAGRQRHAGGNAGDLHAENRVGIGLAECHVDQGRQWRYPRCRTRRGCPAAAERQRRRIGDRRDRDVEGRSRNLGDHAVIGYTGHRQGEVLHLAVAGQRQPGKLSRRERPGAVRIVDTRRKRRSRRHAGDG